jgi:chemotaxis protein CheD
MVVSAAETMEVFLNPGDFHFYRPASGKPPLTRLHTLLGSCVSVILWHPEHRLAGMSHAILPGRGRRNVLPGMDGRYCDEAISLFRQELIRGGFLAQQFHVYLVGGGQMYATQDKGLSIGERNIETARIHLKQAGFLIRNEHVGRECYRKVTLDVKTGAVVVTFNNRTINLTSNAASCVR